MHRGSLETGWLGPAAVTAELALLRVSGGWCESGGTGLLCCPSGARCLWAVVCSTHPWQAAIVVFETSSEGDFDPVLLLV